MNHSRNAAIAVLSVLAAVAAREASAASSLDAYALSAGGQSILGAGGGGFSCATFGPDPRAAAFGGLPQVGLPTDGSVCGVGVDSRAAAGASGSLTVSSNLAVGFGPSSDLKTFVGESAGRAEYGNLGVRASASYTGSTNAFVVTGSQAFGRQTESMTFAGSGAGFYQPTFTIDGSLFGVGRNYSTLAMLYSAGTGPTFLAFRILDAYGDLSFYGPGGYVTSFPGFTTTGDLATGFTAAGSTDITLTIPITRGVATDITFSLWGSVLPSSNDGLLTASGGDVEFMSTARLTHIDVLDGSGNALADFSITSGSGTLYGSNGVISAAAVPEPETWALLALGLAALAGIGSRRSARRR